MTIRAYYDGYLDDAQDILGQMMDYAINNCKMDGDVYFRMFLASGIAEQFERGNPKYFAGMTGGEIVKEVVLQQKGVELSQKEEYDLDKSPAYWCGWILAYYQWKTCRSFKRIHQFLSIKDILCMYPTHHEADEEYSVESFNQIYERTHSHTYLKDIMDALGITIEELSERTEISMSELKMLANDIEKMRYVDATKLYILATALRCSMDELIEF